MLTRVPPESVDATIVTGSVTVTRYATSRPRPLHDTDSRVLAPLVSVPAT